MTLSLKSGVDAYLLENKTLCLKTKESEYIFNDSSAEFIAELINTNPDQVEEINSLNLFKFKVQGHVLKDWLIKKEIISDGNNHLENDSTITTLAGTTLSDLAQRRITAEKKCIQYNKTILCECFLKRNINTAQVKKFAEVLCESLIEEFVESFPFSQDREASRIRLILTETRSDNAILDQKIDAQDVDICIPITAGKDNIEVGPIFTKKCCHFYKIVNERSLIKAGTSHEISEGVPFVASNRLAYDNKTSKAIARMVAYILDREFDETLGITDFSKVWTLPIELIKTHDASSNPYQYIVKNVYLMTSNIDADIDNRSTDLFGKCVNELTQGISTDNTSLQIPVLEKLKNSRSQKISTEAEGGHRLRSSNATRKLLLPFIDQTTGIINEIGLTTIDKNIFMYSANKVMGSSTLNNHKSQTARATGYPISAAGKGRTISQAQVSCIAEAIERYSANFPVLSLPQIIGRYEDLHEVAIEPSTMLMYSENQYNNRDLINEKVNALIHRVPRRFSTTKPTSWSPIVNVLDPQKSKLIPTAMLGFNFVPNLQPGTAVFCSNGLASGNSKAEAMIQALYEIVERDSCALWWYNKLRLNQSIIPSNIKTYIQQISNKLAESGRSLELLQLPSDFNINVTCAVSVDHQGGKICVGLGSHFDQSVSIIRAVTEMYQMLLGIDRYEKKNNITAVGNGGIDGLVGEWLINEKIENHVYLTASGKSNEYHNKGKCFEFIEEELEWVLTQFKSKEMDVYGINLTAQSIGFPVVKLIVPQMRHFWPRFAPGRLYDLPVQLGYLERKKAEHELNEVGFFF